MPSLPPTFETLASTRNEAANDVLIAALADSDSTLRHHALHALLRRTESLAPKMLLMAWDSLNPDDVPILRAKNAWMTETVQTTLREGGELLLNAINAAESLELTSTLDQLILLAESSRARAIRARASEVVLTLVEPLGHAARSDRDKASTRNPVLARLADSVRRFSMHRNEQLVDAYLLTSTWSDGDLRQLLDDATGPMDLICNRFAKSQHPGVVELLAGFLRRRNPTPQIIELMQTRTDVAFRDALLRKVGHEPTSIVLRNLRDMGIPKSCDGGGKSFADLPLDCRAASIHLYGAASAQSLEVLNLITVAVACGGPGCITAAAAKLSRCDVLDIDFWMRAALPVADGDAEIIARDEKATLLQRLIELLDHSDPSLVRGVRRILEPLHADAMMHKLQSLRPRSRKRLGRVVMMIDPNAIERVRDGLRHPVLEHRLEAITMAEALGIVDLLSDLFTRISREDHQQARMRAAEVMADAEGDETLRLLQEMMDLPESLVRDVALKALDHRQKAGAR